MTLPSGSHFTADQMAELICIRYGPILRQYFRERLPEKYAFEVEDLLQNLAIGATRQISTFEWRGESAFLSWLRLQARSHVADWMQWNTRIKRNINRRNCAAPNDEQDGLDALPAATDPVSRPLRHRERAAQLFKAKASLLSEQERDILRMKFVDGHDSEQIGEALGLKAANVRQIASRAVATLRQALDAANLFS